MWQSWGSWSLWRGGHSHMDGSTLLARLQVRSGQESQREGVKEGPAASEAPSSRGAAPGPDVAPLGIHARNASPPLAELALVRRFALQRMARELRPQEHRLQGCSRWLQQSTVQLLHVPKHQAGAFRGLQHCGSVWACPVCSAKISERRRIDLAEGVAEWQARDGKILLVTYTIRHKRADSLKGSLEGLLKARKSLLSGAAAKRFNGRHGIVGRVRALEVTHGKNGWHPHIHELLFVVGDCDRVAVVEELRRMWAQRVEAAGLSDVNDHSVDVQFADMSVGDYVAKFGRERTWGPEHELTKAGSKVGKEGGRGPIGLLVHAFCGDDEAGRLWAEYAEEFKGKRQLSWSGGLRELLKLDAEKSDEEVALELREEAVLMDELTKSEWCSVLGNDARAELLSVLGRGSVAELREFLETVGVDRWLPENKVSDDEGCSGVSSVSGEISDSTDEVQQSGWLHGGSLVPLRRVHDACYDTDAPQAGERKETRCTGAIEFLSGGSS